MSKWTDAKEGTPKEKGLYWVYCKVNDFFFGCETKVEQCFFNGDEFIFNEEPRDEYGNKTSEIVEVYNWQKLVAPEPPEEA